MPPAKNFFLANFYLSDPFISIFPKPLKKFFSVLAVVYAGSCMSPQNKIGHLAHHHRGLVQVQKLSACRI